MAKPTKDGAGPSAGFSEPAEAGMEHTDAGTTDDFAGGEFELDFDDFELEFGDPIDGLDASSSRKDDDDDDDLDGDDGDGGGSFGDGGSDFGGGDDYSDSFASFASFEEPAEEPAPVIPVPVLAIDDDDATEPTGPISGAAARDHDFPSPSDFVTEVDDRIRSTKDDDTVEGGDGTDVVRGHKGDDDIDGGGGDDWLTGGHGEDELDGGAGSDVIDGGKGDDLLIYTLAQNTGETDHYDGGKGVDTLQLNLTADEFMELQDELIQLRDWMEETANPKRSTSHSFSDPSASSPMHPIFATSFGLTVRNLEELKVVVDGEEVDVDQPLPDPEPEPEDEPEPTPEPEPDPEPTPDPEPDPDAADPVIIDLSTSASPPPDSGSTTTTTDGSAVSVETISAALTPGSVVNVSIDVAVTELPPKYDVFMLHDLSGSFYDDLPQVQANFSSLFDGLTAGGDVQFGIGSFVDKPYEPFGWSGSDDYVYKTDLAVTGDQGLLQSTLDSLTTYYGYDWQESQLEALVQTALRSEEVGFRDGAQKFVVLQTDAAFHMAGDFAAVYPDAPENDLDTEIEYEDYPDPADVGALLKAAGIIPVFAVTASVVDYYQALVDSWGFGSVTTIESDSSNIVDAVTAGIEAAVLDLNLSVVGDDFGYISSITPETYADVGPGTYTFDLTLEIPEEDIAYASDGISLFIDGYGEVALDVDIARIDATGDTGNDMLWGSSEANGLYGLAGNDMLDGRDGNDLLEGGIGSDTLTGGLGGDVFVFKTGDGADTITDFEGGTAGTDLIDLRGVTGIMGVTAVLAGAVEMDGATVLDFGDGDTITLAGVDLASLDEGDFLV